MSFWVRPLQFLPARLLALALELTAAFAAVALNGLRTALSHKIVLAVVIQLCPQCLPQQLFALALKGRGVDVIVD